jgi:glycosyltransferase involved in cell wall biosynthesis
VVPPVGGVDRDDLRATLSLPPDAPAAPPVGGISRDDLRAALAIPPDAPVVLSVGRVTPEKNPALLLRAFARLVARRPDARLVLVGVRQGRRQVRALVRDLRLTDRVRLVPPVPRERVGDYYRMADVLAFASTTDTQSLVIAEAESVGLPVVVADAALSLRPGGPAPPRMTSDADPESLAAALLRLLDDGDLRERIRRAALEAARAYPPELYLARLTAAYDHARRAAVSNPAVGRRGPA